MCAYIAMKHHVLYILSDRIMSGRFLYTTPFRVNNKGDIRMFFVYFSITLGRGMEVFKCSLIPLLWALTATLFQLPAELRGIFVQLTILLIFDFHSTIVLVYLCNLYILTNYNNNIYNITDIKYFLTFACDQDMYINRKNKL